MIGNTLGGYRIVEQFGRGGMATVYKAFDSLSERYVAIKTLPEQHLRDETFRTRFEQEAKSIARLEHLHILPMFAYGEEEGITYIVMRYLEAGTLAEYLQDNGALSLKESAQILQQIASALTYAHQHHVLHRDIKPSNILMDNQGNAFLTDFGIAKMVDGTGMDLTGTGLIGTPKYMSPEQCLGKKDLTPASDQYALGIILYEMVTGAVPFDAETPLAVIQQHVSAPLPPPHSYRPDLPEAVESVILKVLSREPEARYPTCNDLANAFSKAVASTATPQLSDDAPTLIFDEKATVISEEWERAHPDRISDKVTQEVTARRQPHTTRDTHETTQATDWRKWVLGAAGIGAILLVLFGAFTFLNDDEDADKTTSTPTNTVVANDAEVDEANSDTSPLSPTEAEATAESTATVTEPTATTPAPTSTIAPTEIALIDDQFTRMDPVTSNDGWEPVIHEFEYDALTVPMALVPKGCYQMGNDPYSSYYDWDGASEWGVMGIPDGGEVCFDEPFWIDVYEVSNEQFNALNGQASLEGEQTDDIYPRDKVNWNEALAFCTGNREARLPTEAEWEYAARGPDNLYHAWGDDLLETTTIPPLNYCEGQCYDQFFYEWADRDFDDGYGGTAPIDTYANGVSWVGAYALNGNVWEWVSTLYDLVEFPYPHDANDGREDLDTQFMSRGLRGGSWEDNRDKIRSTTRFGLNSFTSRNTIGFRCARTYTGMPTE